MRYDDRTQRSVERTQHYTAALQLNEDIQQLQVRWKRYSFSVQERLVLLLTNFGLEAATVATDALEMHMHPTRVFPRQSTVSAHLREDFYSKMRMYRRCIEASLL